MLNDILKDVARYEEELELVADMLDALEAHDYDLAEKLAMEVMVLTDCPERRLAAIMAVFLSDKRSDRLTDKTIHLIYA